MEWGTFKKEERGRKKNASDWICYVSETDRDRERVGEWERRLTNFSTYTQQFGI